MSEGKTGMNADGAPAILVVEDEAFLRDTLVEFLITRGWPRGMSRSCCWTSTCRTATGLPWRAACAARPGWISASSC